MRRDGERDRGRQQLALPVPTAPAEQVGQHAIARRERCIVDDLFTLTSFACYLLVNSV